MFFHTHHLPYIQDSSILNFIFHLQVIVQELRESGVFTSVIAEAYKSMSNEKFWSALETHNSSVTDNLRIISSRKIGNNGESQATARRTLGVTDDNAVLHISATPPQSPPVPDDLVDI